MSAGEVTGALGQLAPGATTLTELYRVPAGKKVKNARVIICNRGAQTSFRVAHAVDGAVDDLKQYVAYDKIIAGQDTGVTVAFKLGADDVVRVYAGTANLSFTCTGIEEYE